MPIAEATRSEILGSLKRHQGLVAKRLQDLLNGQSATLADMKLPQDEDPSEPMTERLRRFLRMLNDVRLRLPTEAFGRCRLCGETLPERELVDLPWADQCRACAGRKGA